MIFRKRTTVAVLLAIFTVVSVPSWAAINNAIPIPKEVKAIRLFLEIHLPDDNLWTWHKTFDISRGVRDGSVPLK